MCTHNTVTLQFPFPIRQYQEERLEIRGGVARRSEIDFTTFEISGRVKKHPGLPIKRKKQKNSIILLEGNKFPVTTHPVIYRLSFLAGWLAGWLASLDVSASSRHSPLI